jgi:steroid delta-isomerase-like uncharacterized protein
MAAEQNKQLVGKIFDEIIGRQNFDALNSIIAHDFVHRSSGAQGPEGFKQMVGQFFEGFPDMKVTVENIIAQDDLVATRGHWTGTHKGNFAGVPASGKRVNVEYVDFWRFKDGKAIENWVQMDMLGALTQVGAMAAPPQSAEVAA